MPRVSNNGLMGQYEFQTEAALDQAAPVNGTYYTILDTVLNARIYGIVIQVDTTGETLQVRITIDGRTIESTAGACTNDTCYELIRRYTGITEDWIITDVANPFSQYKSFILEGRSVKIEVRKTTAAGGGNLKGRVVYGILH